MSDFLIFDVPLYYILNVHNMRWSPSLDFKKNLIQMELEIIKHISINTESINANKYSGIFMTICLILYVTLCIHFFKNQLLKIFQI